MACATLPPNRSDLTRGDCADGSDEPPVDADTVEPPFDAGTYDDNWDSPGGPRFERLPADAFPRALAARLREPKADAPDESDGVDYVQYDLYDDGREDITYGTFTAADWAADDEEEEEEVEIPPLSPEEEPN